MVNDVLIGKKVLLILNPIAGPNKIKMTPDLLKPHIPDSLNITYRYTEYAGHGQVMVQEELPNFDVFVAVGGDGTINEIASVLVNQPEKYLMIIPNGSGNGLANELGIKKPLDKILTRFQRGKVKQIDAMKINDYWSFNISGIGFDAHVAHLFANTPGRGLYNYVRLGIINLFTYKPSPVRLYTDSVAQELIPFILVFANSKQYGNDFEVANEATIDSGQIEVVCLNPFPWWYLPRLMWHVLKKTINNSQYIERLSLSKFSLHTKKKVEMHIDGEPVEFEGLIEIEVYPGALNVVV